MKTRKTMPFILSLIFLTLISCGISVPFMWDGTKVSVTRSSKSSHKITIKDTNYSKANGYDISVMLVYVVQNKVDGSPESYFSSFEKNSRYDTHNSKTFKFTDKNINPAGAKDDKEYPVWMVRNRDDRKYDNGAPNYLFDAGNIGLEPGKTYELSYTLDEDGYIIVRASEGENELVEYTLERAGGKSFTSWKAEDSEFSFEKDSLEYNESGDYKVSLLPVIYARSSNHPNQKFYLSSYESLIVGDFPPETPNEPQSPDGMNEEDSSVGSEI